MLGKTLEGHSPHPPLHYVTEYDTSTATVYQLHNAILTYLDTLVKIAVFLQAWYGQLQDHETADPAVDRTS